MPATHLSILYNFSSVNVTLDQGRSGWRKVSTIQRVFVSRQIINLVKQI